MAENGDVLKPDDVFSEAPGRHICLVVKDLDKTVSTLSEILGLGPWIVIDAKFDKDDVIVSNETLRFKVALTKLEKLGLGRLCLEIIEPVSEGSIYDEFLKTRGEGLHHVATLVPNWDEVVAKYEEKGLKRLLGAQTPGKGKWSYFEIEPGGLVIEAILDTGKLPDWKAAGATVRL